MKTPFRWIGSKSVMMPHLVDIFPPHRMFVDVFGGSGTVVLHKPPSPLTVYNDIDEGLTNFFEVIRKPETFEKFYEQAQWFVNSRSLWDNFRKHWNDPDDPVEKALRWWYVACLSFGGRWGGGWAQININTAKNGRGSADLDMFRARLREVHRIFSRVLVEHMDFRDLIPRFDSPETLFYCDPPYPKESRASEGNVYEHDAKTDDLHPDLIATLLKVEGMALLSSYETDTYQPLIDAGWEMVVKKTRRAQATGRVGKLKGSGAFQDGSDIRIEVVYANPAAIEKINAGRLL